MKIIKITEDKVFIGTDDGQFFEVKKTDLDFKPELGMEVEKYTLNGEVIIIPKKASNSNKNYNNVTVNNKYEYAPSGKVVNKLVYILLALFLGGLGIHKFYAGKFTGILYILFCWTIFPSIIAFIEAIMACFKPADDRGNIIV